jgi:hypothetical protein
MLDFFRANIDKYYNSKGKSSDSKLQMSLFFNRSQLYTFFNFYREH